MPWRLGVSGAQCEAITKAGRRCAITATSTLKDDHGRCIAEPLRCGGRTCAIHLELFYAQPCPLCESDVCIFWLDFETSGLDVLHDEILEVALTEDRSNAQFATTVRPIFMPNGSPGVHGIEADELLTSPSFHEVFRRMLFFINTVVENSLGYSGRLTDAELVDHVTWLPTLRDPAPRVVLIGHNAMKFDFPILVSECLRHNCNLFELEDFYFCDTLPVLRAMGAHIAGGCARLQCLARCCNSAGGDRAHRALEDTVALRSVVHHCAGTLGLSPEALLCPFMHRFDVNATLAVRSFTA